MSGGLSFTPVGDPLVEPRSLHAFSPDGSLLPLCVVMGGPVEPGGYTIHPDPERVTCQRCLEWMHG